MARKGEEGKEEEGILAWIDSKINFLTANPQIFLSLGQSVCAIDLIEESKWCGECTQYQKQDWFSSFSVSFLSE